MKKQKQMETDKTKIEAKCVDGAMERFEQRHWQETKTLVQERERETGVTMQRDVGYRNRIKKNKKMRCRVRNRQRQSEITNA